MVYKFYFKNAIVAEYKTNRESGRAKQKGNGNIKGIWQFYQI